MAAKKMMTRRHFFLLAAAAGAAATASDARGGITLPKATCFVGEAKFSAVAAEAVREGWVNQPIGQRIPWLRNFISVAEFLAREVRSSAAGTAQENPTP